MVDGVEEEECLEHTHSLTALPVSPAAGFDLAVFTGWGSNGATALELESVAACLLEGANTRHTDLISRRTSASVHLQGKWT